VNRVPDVDLGVLLDRLDKTSNELKTAKEELHADDVTDDVTIPTT
jgi:hypothetical protein